MATRLSPAGTQLSFQPLPTHQVPQAVYIWPMVAFATATVLNLASACLELRPIKRQLCFLAAYITFTALVFEALAAQGRAPIFYSVSGRPVSLLRYVMWAHATPIIIYTLSMISDFDTARVWRLVFVDLVMILTIIPGELVDGVRALAWAGIVGIWWTGLLCSSVDVRTSAPRVPAWGSSALARIETQFGIFMVVKPTSPHPPTPSPHPPFTAAWHRWIWNIISFAVFPFICSELWSMYSSAIQASR